MLRMQTAPYFNICRAPVYESKSPAASRPCPFLACRQQRDQKIKQISRKDLAVQIIRSRHPQSRGCCHTGNVSHRPPRGPRARCGTTLRPTLRPWRCSATQPNQLYAILQHPGNQLRMHRGADERLGAYMPESHHPSLMRSASHMHETSVLSCTIIGLVRVPCLPLGASQCLRRMVLQVATTAGHMRASSPMPSSTSSRSQQRLRFKKHHTTPIRPAALRVINDTQLVALLKKYLMKLLCGPASILLSVCIFQLYMRVRGAHRRSPPGAAQSRPWAAQC